MRDLRERRAVWLTSITTLAAFAFAAGVVLTLLGAWVASDIAGLRADLAGLRADLAHLQ